MIWYAIRVTPQREFLFELLLRWEFCDPAEPEKRNLLINPFVPVKYIAERKFRQIGRRRLRPYPQHTGLLFLGVACGERVPWERIQRFDKLFRSIITNSNGEPRILTEAEMIRICGQSQRPYIVSPKGRKNRRQFQPNAEIISGPHQGRLVKVTFPDPRKSEKPTHEADEIFELLATGA